MNEREAYIRQVFETTLYFRDMYEEDGGGHTGLIKLLKPMKYRFGHREKEKFQEHIL